MAGSRFIFCETVQKLGKDAVDQGTQEKVSRGRGRPRGFDPEQALKAAGERFRTQGFAATTLDDLVAATGLARPSLYAAFGDKRALYLAALKRVSARLEQTFDRLEAAQLPKGALLEAIFANTIDGYLTGERAPAGCVMVSTAAAEAVNDEEIRAALLAFLTMQDNRMTALFDKAWIARPRAAARLVMSVLHSLSVRARAGTPPAELEAIAADCIALIA
ncbi:TetR/AcrR family transcriptional regulator [soil metagenome]